jgi:hypothetical protein
MVGYRDYEVSFPDDNTMLLTDEDGQSWTLERIQ